MIKCKMLSIMLGVLYNTIKIDIFRALGIFLSKSFVVSKNQQQKIIKTSQKTVQKIP